MLRRFWLPAIVLLLASCAQPSAGELRQGIVGNAEIWRPAGKGPHAAVIVLHGCGGRYPHEADWAAALAEGGYLAYVPDSFAARGWSRTRGRRTTCNGIGLWGRERAVDVLHALDALRRMPEVDGARIAVLGFSHGGWTAFDLLALSQNGGWDNWPADGATRLAALRAVIGVYPYCGFAARAAEDSWTSPVPMLILQAESDRTVSNAECQAMAERQRGRGVDVRLHAYPGLGHGFDFDPARNDGYSRNFDAAATRDAMRRVIGFLDQTMRK
ncbi:MAG: dienelactone hydrolase family protein [Alphaproteobacteria bacterium]|nr:dienelactone hydrolase family protein [Alphaproteobacteria bacterium]